MSDPFVGKSPPRLLAASRPATVPNATTGKTERRILQMHANHREEREEIPARATPPPVSASSRRRRRHPDLESAPIVLESDLPGPQISVAVEPKSKADQTSSATASPASPKRSHFPRHVGRGDGPDADRRAASCSRSSTA
jgi:elongation factor G